MDTPIGATKQKDFDSQLAFGKEFEDLFARFLINRGWFVTPKYLFSEEGAPLLIGKHSKYAIPDIDAARNGRRIWVECKRKNKMERHPATGYPLEHHHNYKKVQEITGDKVFVVFWDESIKEEDGKYYGNWIDELDKNIYKTDWVFIDKSTGKGKKHITFKYPEAFIKVKV